VNPPLLLIADDEPLLVAALVRLARRAGLRCISDTTSLRVLSLAREHHPDVVILDLRQAVDGRELLAQLKGDPETRDISVVVLTALEDPSARQACLRLGAADYALKPFDGTFIQRVARLALQHQAAAPR
jgi:CheY-like chemotaxis protein